MYWMKFVCISIESEAIILGDHPIKIQDKKYAIYMGSYFRVSPEIRAKDQILSQSKSHMHVGGQ